VFARIALPHATPDDWRAAIRAHVLRPGYDHTTGFGFGLDLILDASSPAGADAVRPPTGGARRPDAGRRGRRRSRSRPATPR
jgi:hypothetical protein